MVVSIETLETHMNNCYSCGSSIITNGVCTHCGNNTNPSPPRKTQNCTRSMMVASYEPNTVYGNGTIVADEGLYYVSKFPNTDHPSHGIAKGSYAGAFDMTGLISYMAD